MNTWMYPVALLALLVAGVTGYSGVYAPKKQEVPPAEERPFASGDQLILARLTSRPEDPTKLSGPGVGIPHLPLPYPQLRRCRSAAEVLALYHLGLQVKHCTRRTAA